MKDSIRKIKIIQFTHCSHSYFLDKKGNPDDIVKGSWFAQVARELKRLYPDLDVECWCPEKLEKKEKQFIHNGIKFRIFPVTFSPRYALDFSIPMLLATKKEIKENEKKGIKTILHIHEVHNIHSLLIISLFKKQKIIAQHHGGSWPLKHLRQNKSYKLFLPFFVLGQIWENLVLKNIDCYYALSSDEIDYFKKRAPFSKVIFQTMGITDDYFNFMSKIKARKRLKLNPKKKIILYIGRINKVKGIRYLLDAMKELDNIELKIIGYLQDVDYFKDYAKKLKLKNVEFLGGKFGEEKMAYLSAADALILPSAKEGAPVTIMEALARNLPVVATNVGGIPLMLKNRENGIIIKPKSTKDIIRGVREILKLKKKNIKKFAEQYRWEGIIKKTMKDYLDDNS